MKDPATEYVPITTKEKTMINIKDWMKTFLKSLNDTFGNRVWFVGLQGSYGRGEATDSSDIDVVVILDELSAMDIMTYDLMLNTLPYRELICGFLSGKNELLNWEPSDLFQFYYDTIPIKGSLDALLPLLDDSAIDRAIKIGICNIYHGCVHNMLHDKSVETLKSLYKSASFVVQAITHKRIGRHISSQKELLSIISPDERFITETHLKFRIGASVELVEASKELFVWAQKWISKV